MIRATAFAFVLGLAAVAASSQVRPAKTQASLMPIPLCPPTQPNCTLIEQ